MLIILLFFAACSSTSGPHDYELGEEFELFLGKKATISPYRVAVTFADVLEDSRCPANANCFWAGNGKVQIQVAKDDVQLNTFLEPHQASINDFTIQLVGLEPYPEYPIQFEKEDYKVRLVIKKR